MSPITRRLVLVGTAAGAASLLVPVIVRSSIAQSSKDETAYEITDWMVVASTGEVTLGLSQPEVGQGSYTVLPQILADELDVDWQRVKVRFVTGKDAYKIAFKNEAPAQKEGASMSTTTFYERLRIAGAAAREALTRAAAQKGCGCLGMSHREGFRDQRQRKPTVLRRACAGSGPASAQHPSASQGAPPVYADRQADTLFGFTGQVDRQRALRHRCRRP